MVVDEPDSDLADRLIEACQQHRVDLIAPAFFALEAESILRKKVIATKELSLAEASTVVQRLRELPIYESIGPMQRHRAWQIATEFGLPTVYDATYLALAEIYECVFWTADRRLVNSVGHKLSYTKLLSEQTLRDWVDELEN